MWYSAKDRIASQYQQAHAFKALPSGVKSHYMAGRSNPVSWVRCQCPGTVSMCYCFISLPFVPSPTSKDVLQTVDISGSHLFC